MSEPWLAPTVLSPSTWRRRFLTGASAACAVVAAVFALQLRHVADDATASLLAGAAWQSTGLGAAMLVAVVASLAALRAAWKPSASDSAGRVLRVDGCGRIALAPGLRRGRATARPHGSSGVAIGNPAPATALYVGPLFVVLSATDGPALVWCDSLPRVGFRRLVVAARWGAGGSATASRVILGN